MENLGILVLIIIIFFAVIGSEDAQPKPTANKMVKEIFSNGDPNKCQIFREWIINDERVGCCTDDRSIPLTLCVNEYGFEIEKIN